jgi:hypothetical protein
LSFRVSICGPHPLNFRIEALAWKTLAGTTGRGIRFGKEGIKSQFGELKTGLQFSKYEVSRDQFAFGQSLVMALGKFPTPDSGLVTH